MSQGSLKSVPRKFQEGSKAVFRMIMGGRGLRLFLWCSMDAFWIFNVCFKYGLRVFLEGVLWVI